MTAPSGPFASAPENYAESTAAFVPGMPTGIDPARIQMSPESTAPHPLVYEAPARRFFDGTLKGLSLSELPEKEAKTLPLGENYKTRKTYS